jgi:Leucine-rich repeat (LRR) protein
MPNLVTDQPTTETEEAIIPLANLNANTPDRIWEQFFIQQGKESVWKILQTREDTLHLYSNQNHQDSQVTIAILRYLDLHQLSIKFKLCINTAFEYDEEARYVIPEETNNFSSLQDLKLSNSSLSTIPIELLNFTNLRVLDLSDNQIHEVFPEINNFTNLSELNFSHNKLTTLPYQVSNLTGLRSLNLHANQIKKLPIEIVKLNKLAYLTLSCNELENLPIPVINFINLSTINLSCNQLKELPTEIIALPKLSFFYISGNLIEYIPSQIGNCTTLHTLDLADNCLKEIPSEIGKLTNLRMLILSYNQLNTLPAEICNLTKLAYFRIDNNNFTRLRASLFPLISSSRFENTVLFLDNNPWIDVSSNLLIKIEQAELEATIYEHFPFSLTTLCIQYIEQHPEFFSTQELELDNNLPHELSKTARKNHLKHSSLWKKSFNIVFFKNIINKCIPFYLDFPITSTKGTVQHILNQLEEEQFYSIRPILKDC